jgi:hypothetical protein
VPLPGNDLFRTPDFWLILFGSTLIIGAIGAVIPQFILFLKDQGYAASRVFSGLLSAGLAGRVVVSYVADRWRKKNVMTLF